MMCSLCEVGWWSSRGIEMEVGVVGGAPRHGGSGVGRQTADYRIPGLFAEMATGANLFLRDAGGARVTMSRDIPGFRDTLYTLV